MPALTEITGSPYKDEPSPNALGLNNNPTLIPLGVSPSTLPPFTTRDPLPDVQYGNLNTSPTVADPFAGSTTAPILPGVQTTEFQTGQLAPPVPVTYAYVTLNLMKGLDVTIPYEKRDQLDNIWQRLFSEETSRLGLPEALQYGRLNENQLHYIKRLFRGFAEGFGDVTLRCLNLIFTTKPGAP